MLRIAFDLTRGGYVVIDGARQTFTTDLIEAVALADPHGTGTVRADAITQQHLNAYCDAPATYPH